jgi:DNA-binding CsgD family transcriptional regulator
MGSAGAMRMASPAMVGRDSELHTLVSMVSTMRPGAPAVALVGGRAGMGKTRLVSAATERWQTAGARVLSGSCAPIEGTPYASLATALRAALPANMPVLRMLSSHRAASRSDLFDAIGSTLATLSERAPLILVTEDLHWSDRATRDALAYLVTHSFGGRWGLVATHRYEGPLSLSEIVSFADVVARGGPVVRLTLEPLTPVQVSELAMRITGVRPNGPEAESLHRRTGGIPLLVEEVVARRDSTIPEHLRSMFATRVAGHGSDVRSALQVLAVADQCTEIEVAAALDTDADTIADALKRARDSDLVVIDTAGYRFCHDLLREALYEEVPPGRRRELHRRVASLLANRADVEPAVLARHWHLAGEREQAALASLAAAEEAELLHAPAAAHTHYELVLDAWPRLTEPARRRCGPRVELLRRAAYAAERSGEFARAVNLAAERVAEPDTTAAEQALCWERLARYRWEAGDGFGSRAAYQQAVDVLPASAPAATRAQVLSGLAWHLAATFQYEDARPFAAAALEAGADVDDPAVRWQVYLAQGIAWLGTEAGHEALTESCRLATAVGVGDRIAITRMWLNLSNLRLGHTAQREPNLRIALRAAAADGLGSSLEAALRYMLAEYLSETGRWDEALVELDLNRHVSGIPALFSWGYRSRLASWRGDIAAAEEALQQTRSLTAGAPHQPVPLTVALAAQCAGLLWEGRVDEAVAKAREAVELGSVSAYEMAEPLAVLCRATADLAERARRDGRDLDPAIHTEVAARRADLAGEQSPRATAFVATCDAELTRIAGQRTAAPWRRAVQAWESAGDPYQEAGARWRLAWALLADRSGRAEAAAHLARARAIGSDMGAGPLARAVDRLATSARLHLGPSRPPTADRSLAAALTARELEVLPLLAAGRSNAEIAEILVISPRTAGVHVSRILSKLGADRRAQVAGLARSSGLLDE